MPEHAGASRIRGRPCEHLFARRPLHPTGFVLTHQHRVRGVFASPRVPSRPKYRNGMNGSAGQPDTSDPPYSPHGPEFQLSLVGLCDHALTVHFSSRSTHVTRV
jgi:hypothetical protein